ncbi:nuclear transport factor 2 family protein [Mycolicibacterium sp. BiH015]|uniref:nuclear transport factor 2 family protein n=1 Tax=Mycolicibacterium sp. BiH015 TaxID=3018808 RepID=UPI0022E29C69|nr:nuclear transport factor 2 family protein [Mycolicibacterium sp. BiH015]MDA2894917.1 nuclear transport factor 2 family protein [Mycolicibacterium sp. BiH015]
MTGSERGLQALIVYSQLEQAKARYCRLMDTKAWSTLGDLLTEDVAFDLAGDDPSSVAIVGRDDVLAAVRSSVADAVTVHQVHSPEFEIVSADEVRAIWAVQERVVWENGTSLTAFGHYHDRWVRADGAWRIAELRLTHLIMEFGEADPA